MAADSVSGNIVEVNAKELLRYHVTECKRILKTIILFSKQNRYRAKASQIPYRCEKGEPHGRKNHDA